MLWPKEDTENKNFLKLMHNNYKGWLYVLFYQYNLTNSPHSTVSIHSPTNQFIPNFSTWMKWGLQYSKERQIQVRFREQLTWYKRSSAVCGVMMAGARGYTSGATIWVSALVRLWRMNHASDFCNLGVDLKGACVLLAWQQVNYFSTQYQGNDWHG